MFIQIVKRTPLKLQSSGYKSTTAAMRQADSAFSILVVEDDKVTRELIGRLFGRKYPKAAIYLAENGKVGVELFEMYAPDLVVTDINMPVMDGIRMAGEIRAMEAAAKFIVITAYSDMDYLDKFTGIGFSAFLTKPIEFDRMFAAIEKCFAEIEQERSSKNRN
jgi:two-component system, sensor histidine kinase and response regulator